MKTTTTHTAIPAQADMPARDQSGAIRTLTEEEMAVISGGFNLQAMVYQFQHTNWTALLYRSRYKGLDAVALRSGPWI